MSIFGQRESHANGNIIFKAIQQLSQTQVNLMNSAKRKTPSINLQDPTEVQEAQAANHRTTQKKVKTTSSVRTNASPYQEIPEVPNIHLNIEQMNSDPLALIKQLEQTYAQFGAVKLTVSDAWNCPFTFGYADRPITVRVQNIQQLQEGKPFEQKVQSLRVSEYKDNASRFSQSYKFRTSPRGTTQESIREHQYWNLVTGKKFEKDPVSVEYAADLPSSCYGSGFPTRKIHNWLDADFDYEKNLFNLNNLYRSPSSLLRIIDAKNDKISGITQPWMYLGMQFATFCWHVEDLFIHSINYNHLGETKTWYVIPGKHKQDFDNYVQRNFETSRKKNLLEKITLMVDPLQLRAAGIPVYRINQRPRDYAVTFLKAYHSGFSHGFNICEAVNFAHYDDVSCIKESLLFYKEQEKVSASKKCKSHVLSYEWAIYETVLQKLLKNDDPYFEKIAKEYKRVINREYIFVKETVEKYGEFADVKMIPFQKRYYVNKCSFCQNYLYLTSLECSKCHQNLCERHLDKCKCESKSKSKSWILVIRELNVDRLKIKDIVPLVTTKMRELQLSQ